MNLQRISTPRRGGRRGYAEKAKLERYRNLAQLEVLVKNESGIGPAILRFFTGKVR